MNDTTTKRLVAFLLLLGILCACGKKSQEPGRTPNLEMPASSAPPDAFKAAKEASASKGAVKLTLRLYKTKVKADGSLWLQLELGNAGEYPFAVSDDLFYDPVPPPVRTSVNSADLYVRVTDAKGRAMDYLPPFGCDLVRPGPAPLWQRLLSAALNPEKRSSLVTSDEESPRVRGALDTARRLRAHWRAQGLEPGEVDRKTVLFMRGEDERAQEAAEANDTKNLRELAPGRSVASVPFAYGNIYDCDSPYRPGTPIGPYSELPVVGFDLVPGKRYFIQAVYDYAFLKEGEWGINGAHGERKEFEALLSKGRLSPQEKARWKRQIEADLSQSVRIETPKIEFEAAP